MSMILALLTVAEMLTFLFLDLARHRKDGLMRVMARALSGITGALLAAADLLPGKIPEVQAIPMDIAFATEILLMYPLSYEKPVFSLKVSAYLAALALSFGIASLLLPSSHAIFRSQKTVASAFLVMVSFAVCLSVSASRRLGGIRLFFRNSAVWHYVEDYTRFLYSQAFTGLVVLSLCGSAVPGNVGTALCCLSAVLFMGLYALLYMRALTGRTYILNSKTENRIKDIIKGNLRTSFIDKAEEDRLMNNLYRKIMFFMAEKKPYLDPSFCMNDLAERVYSNKLYLSRTINLLSGRNFRQFVNYHRVQYAISLFRKDPKLKVSEVSEMSGFHSTVSFNMAFKVNTGKTPSEWLRDHLSEQVDRF